MKKGTDLLSDALANRGTAFTFVERERLGLTGLLPARVEGIGEQAARALAQVRAKPTPIERYLHLSALQAENETLFFRVLIDNLDELVPVVYTPAVGQACLDWSRNWLRPRGLYITPRERGRMAEVLRRWPREKVGIIVVTDGSRILGLGDLGANGMGIPIGKLVLYCACAGIDPALCLPVTLDLGTDTQSVRDDPSYVGLHEPRLRGAAYEELMEEFIAATQDVFPGVLVQFEDFSNPNAFRLLARYRGSVCAFNDDIQGTGAMGLAGLLAAERITGRRLADERILFVGAGGANIGIGSIVLAAMMKEGLSEGDSMRRCWFKDSQGLVVTSRSDLAEHKRRFARDQQPMADLHAILEAVRPTVLIGASGQAGLFTEPVLEAMGDFNERPVIYALSNPTSKAECTAEQAYRCTQGRAIFASGSPFAPVSVREKVCATGQGNNAFIFPGVGLAVLACRAMRVTDEMFFAGAQALGAQVTDEDLIAGRIFPPAARLRQVAAAVAVAVAEVAYEQGLATVARPADLSAYIEAQRYRAEYPSAG